MSDVHINPVCGEVAVVVFIEGPLMVAEVSRVMHILHFSCVLAVGVCWNFLGLLEKLMDRIVLNLLLC